MCRGRRLSSVHSMSCADYLHVESFHSAIYSTYLQPSAANLPASGALTSVSAVPQETAHQRPLPVPKVQP